MFGFNLVFPHRRNLSTPVILAGAKGNLRIAASWRDRGFLAPTSCEGFFSSQHDLVAVICLHCETAGLSSSTR
ncbi:hypothetical protein I308_105588 [Cryptococcus tetragattii IND107]|uniref:Uncharacterized protein n=1 Tax=Cryptococcus tetragattii IND107 TaxID=1296105 RepID=A0ABR3BPT7_9TREE